MVADLYAANRDSTQQRNTGVSPTSAEGITTSASSAQVDMHAPHANTMTNTMTAMISAT
jgi:hypothetical protein